jgi:hypothetical protein
VSFIPKVMTKHKNMSRKRGRVPRPIGKPQVLPGERLTEDLVATTLRYGVQGGIQNVAVLRRDMLNAIGFAASTTNLYRLFQAIRIREVRMYCGSPTAAGTFGITTNTTLQWTCGDSRPRTLNAVTMGTGSISGIRTKPPAHSLASFWSTSGSNETDPLFSYDANIGDVIEIDVVYQLQNDITNGTSVSFVISSGLVLGNLYQLALDHSATSKTTAIGRLSAA